MKDLLSRILCASGFLDAGLAADAVGRLSGPLSAPDPAGVYEPLFLRRRRDRAVH